jgi:PRTRC genetic system protein E
MFIELLPLLAGRTVVITVALENDKTVRVNIIPKVKDNENLALSTPLSYTGTPEELDAGTRQTPGQLRRVLHAVGKHTGPGQS